MSVDRRRGDRFASDRMSAELSLRDQMQFVADNLEQLEKLEVQSGSREKSGMLRGANVKFDNVRRVEMAKALYSKMLNGEELADWERAKIEALYEDVWRGYGLPSVLVHRDKRRRGLRFG